MLKYSSFLIKFTNQVFTDPEFYLLVNSMSDSWKCLSFLSIYHLEHNIGLKHLKCFNPIQKFLFGILKILSLCLLKVSQWRNAQFVPGIDKIKD